MNLWMQVMDGIKSTSIFFPIFAVLGSFVISAIALLGRGVYDYRQGLRSDGWRSICYGIMLIEVVFFAVCFLPEIGTSIMNHALSDEVFSKAALIIIGLLTVMAVITHGLSTYHRKKNKN